MRNKYGAVKTVVDGITFDSKAEAKYYVQLVERKLSGEIKDFELQPKFLLRPGFTKNGKRHRATHYIADFKVIYQDDSFDIVDVKGVETEVFKIKRKLFEETYPELSLQIVKNKDAAASKSVNKRKQGGRADPGKVAERKQKSRERRELRKRV